MNIAIVTGASSGLGRSFIRQLDRQGGLDEIWGVARRRERMEELAAQLSTPMRPLALDLTKTESVETLRALLQETGADVRVLVNSAGFGKFGTYADMTLQETADMIDLNCRALTHMTHICLPFMKRGSRIIQLASSAAFLPQPGFAVYAAGKSYVLSFSRALGEELREKGIFVTAVCPGPVRTEFFERAERKASTLAIKKYVMADAKDVVADALYASARRHPSAVYSLPIRAFGLLTKLCPHSLILMITRFLKRM